MRPEAAVLPAPIGYIKVAAAKKLIVGSQVMAADALFAASTCLCSGPALPVRPPCPWLGGCLDWEFNFDKI